MKHAVIFANPKPRSFTSAVASAYAETVKTLGHGLIERDLYRMEFDPRLQPGELPFDEAFAPATDVVEERALLRDVNVFAFVYPLWLNSPPAILKGYLERVFGFGFAYGSHGRSEPLLQGRRIISFSSSGAPLHWVKENGTFNAVQTLFDTYFADVCGMSVIDHLHFGGITPGIRADWVDARMNEVREMARAYFGNIGPG